MSNARLVTQFLGCVCLAFLTGLAPSGSARAADTGAPAVAPVADAISPPKFLAAWGREGSGDGEFKSPIGIAINAADEVFVTDAGNANVQRFTSDGKFLDKVSTGAFPGGTAIDREGLVYVAVMLDYKISVFRPKPQQAAADDAAPSFVLVREWGSKGTAAGQFDQPGGLAFGLDGTLYVCDQVNHRVQRFTPDGRFLAQWGEYGDADGQFGKPEPPANRVGGPCLAAIDREGNLYTTEPTRGRIQAFSPAGKWLASWGTNEARNGAFGGGKNLQGPIAILFDRDDRAWVSATNHRVQLFTTAGQYLTGLGNTATPGAEPGQFQTPHGMALDSRGALYVVDTRNHRVQKFAFDAASPR